MALRVPVVQRDHVHDLLDADTGAVGPTEQWKFTRVGDVRALGRFQDAWVEQGVQWALLGGFKLPTGSRNIVNADGDRAERALQPQAWSPQWSTVLQLDHAHKQRDSGLQAEPDNSGSTTTSLSPGFSVAVATFDTVYAFVQLPLYQYVNGIQLVPRASFVMGWTHSF